MKKDESLLEIILPIFSLFFGLFIMIPLIVIIMNKMFIFFDKIIN